MTKSDFNCIRCRRPLIIGSTSCINCGLVFDSPVPSESASSVAAYDKPQATRNKSLLQIRVVSGQEYLIRDVLLFDELALADATRIKAQAIRKLGGFSSGLGSFGNFGSVVTSSLIIGAVENVISANLKQEGLKMLETAEALLIQCRNYNNFFPLDLVSNVGVAIPFLWRATINTAPNTERFFVHNGDPTITVRLEDESTVCIVWDKVETYQLRNT